jgi:hypothetical protein
MITCLALLKWDTHIRLPAKGQIAKESGKKVVLSLN